jgi:hypothetical protein
MGFSTAFAVAWGRPSRFRIRSNSREKEGVRKERRSLGFGRDVKLIVLFKELLSRAKPRDLRSLRAPHPRVFYLSGEPKGKEEI